MSFPARVLQFIVQQKCFYFVYDPVIFVLRLQENMEMNFVFVE